MEQAIDTARRRGLVRGKDLSALKAQFLVGLLAVSHIGACEWKLSKAEAIVPGCP